MSNPKTDAERLAILEYKSELQEDKLEEMNKKLDELLQLRSKGMGAFWVASSLLGTGIIGTVVMFISWIKGVPHYG